ncbi:MAG TPA: YciI family protein [Ilumatobacter sp.]|jgi:hypothetical protein|nr:YciI family protein [Ilumatobacter sp.]
MTVYLLSVHGDDTAELPGDFDIEQVYADVDKVNKEMMQKGVWVFGGGLHPADTATVVRADGGDVVTTDGPYLESKEHIGGFWIIKADDLDEALGWAKKATVACRGPVEVRPFQDDTEV